MEPDTPATAPQPPGPLRPIGTRRMAAAAAPIAAVLVVALGLIGALFVVRPGAAPASSPDGSQPATASAAPASVDASRSPQVSAAATTFLADVPPAGRNEVPWQSGTSSQAIIVVDASETDPATSWAIRAGLFDLVSQLPEYDVLSVISTADTVRVALDGEELQGVGRTAALDAVMQLQFGGSRNLVAGVEAATALAAKSGNGSYDVLLIATGTETLSMYALKDAIRPPSEGGVSHVAIDLHAIAVGSGEHERLLDWVGSDNDGSYQWAAGPADIAQAFVPYRLAVSEATLLGFGSVGDGAQTVSAWVSPDRSHAVRFTVYSPARSRTVEARSPSGRTYDVDTHDRDVTVQELGERVTIVVNGADEGEWQVRFPATGDEPAADWAAWYEVEETLNLFAPLVTAYGTGDTSNDLRFGLALGSDTDVRAATARIISADGDERVIDLTRLGVDELNIGYLVTVGAIVEQPAAGSYRVILRLDRLDSGGHRLVFEWVLGAYVAPVRDSDGDRITDVAEERIGLDPYDPADGATDFDHDGLTTAEELVDRHTEPAEWDTDRGGESDGAEVSAGRDPLDESDDVREPSCAELIPTPAPGAPTPDPAVTPQPAPELEAILPEEVLGHPTEKASMRAPERLDFVFALFDAFLACTGTTRQDLRIAAAVVPELESWSVVAVQIDGVSGREMEDIWFFRLAPGGPGGNFRDLEVDGRSYRQTENGWATYSTADTFFWITSLSYGDYPPLPPPDLPSPEKIVKAFVRQLPRDR